VRRSIPLIGAVALSLSVIPSRAADDEATIRKVTVTVTIGNEDKEVEGSFKVTVTTSGGLELFSIED
jgi:hypothetical protein